MYTPIIVILEKETALSRHKLTKSLTSFINYDYAFQRWHHINIHPGHLLCLSQRIDPLTSMEKKSFTGQSA